MGHADPIAQAEIDRLTAENERLLAQLERHDGEACERLTKERDELRAKVARVEALGLNDRNAVCPVECGSCVWPSQCEGAQLTRYLPASAIRKALADPEESDV